MKSEFDLDANGQVVGNQEEQQKPANQPERREPRQDPIPRQEPDWYRKDTQVPERKENPQPLRKKED